MLFTAPVFLFAFLPLVIVATFLASRLSTRAAMAVLILASCYFYGSWQLWALGILLISTAANLALGYVIIAMRSAPPWPRRLVLWAGCGANLAVLGYFKYANFFLETSGLGNGALDIILPLGLSFITFQKIAFLTDVYKGHIEKIDPLGFSLLITFFPQLVAGPIVHYRHLVPQFSSLRVTPNTLALGLSVFAVGLAKKTFIADNLAGYANGAFRAAETGIIPGAWAWMGSLAYTFQLYFDFSGYSDMALGLGLMFGVTLPLNFLSPYKSTSIVEFWRRWHITLSGFLRHYLYIPLGGNRHGSVARYRNLFLTMLLGGLWHGAAWTFVAWGALHGLYLIANHLWRGAGLRLPGMVGWSATFLAVVVAWVFFRAPDFPTAGNLLQSMAGAGGLGLPFSVLGFVGADEATMLQWGSGLVNPIDFAAGCVMVAAAAIVALAFPNTAEIFGIVEGARRSVMVRMTRSAPAVGVCLWLGMLTVLSGAPTEFLYFQF